MVDVMPGDAVKGRDRAMVMLGFAGAFRKSEVVALNYRLEQGLTAG
jgi:site-specific recombinase XerC